MIVIQCNHTNVSPRLPWKGRIVMNVMLTPDIESSLAKKAQHLGTTPELLALDLLRQQLFGNSQNGSQELAGNLADFLEPHVGVLSTGGAQLSKQSGDKFAEGLLNKHRKTQP